MTEIKQNLNRLYKIFKSTKFPFYNKGQLNKPIKRESFLKAKTPLNNLYFTSRLYRYEKYNPKRKLKSGILKIKSLDKNHPDFKIIENHKTKLKTNNNLSTSQSYDLYKVSTKILGSEWVEYNQINNNNLLNILNEKDDYEYKILLQKHTQKNNKENFFPKYKNATTNTYNSLTERNSFSKFPPIKNIFLKKHFGIKMNNKQ